MHAVVFDIDGTLIQSVETDEILYKQSIRTVVGDVVFRSRWSEYDSVTDSGILSQVFDDNSIGPSSAQARQIESVFLASLESHISTNGAFIEVPGAKDFLERLYSSHGHGVAIATGGWRSSAVLKLNSAGFEFEGVPIATSSESTDRAEIMTIAASRLGDEFQSITYYGDGVWDKDACAKLGWQFVPVGDALKGISSYHGVCVA